VARLPANEYAAREAARQAVVAATERVHVRLGNAKVAIFLAGLAYWAVTLDGSPRPAIYGAAVISFIALALWHELVMRAMARANAAVLFYRHGIARIEDRWNDIGETGERFRDSQHPYSGDLDVFGPGSVFQLISGARTPMGEERLAAWLSAPAEPHVIRERQSRIAGLRHLNDLRERIAVVNAHSRRRILPDALIAWAEAAPGLPRAVGPLVIGLALSFAAAVLNYLSGGRAMPMAVLLPINLAVLWWLARRANAIVEGLSAATEAAGLDLLSKVVAAVESEAFDDPSLKAFAGRLTADGVASSRGIAGLARVSDWADSRHNVFARLLEIPALFTVQVAVAAEAWKRRHGAQMRAWVDVVAEMEALLSLAGFAYEHPDDPFPEIVEAAGGEVVFEGADLAHPLIPAATAIRNSVGLGHGAAADAGLPQTQVLIVSGSNMSGKSTLMRTVGLNAVLALAGAPVRASRLRLSPLAVGTSLRHTDSLHEGRSGFYTEVLRIRLVADLLDGPRAVLFLFDELLSGTNSKDRRIAAEGLLRMMIEGGAIGMVTTHDLALTDIAAIFPAKVRNVHLQDHVENGQMRFDYRLRDGIITHSNALELLRMIGLDVGHS
jgi:hypothetical protein